MHGIQQLLGLQNRRSELLIRELIDVERRDLLQRRLDRSDTGIDDPVSAFRHGLILAGSPP